MISNGTRGEGYFFDSHHSDSANWQNLQFDSEESPIVDQNFVDRIIEKHGKDSDEYRIRVKGLFPKEGTMDDQGYVPLIAKEQIQLAAKKEFVGRKRMGVDPAGEGDDTAVWAVRDSFHAKIAAKENVSNPKTIGSKTITLSEHFKIEGDDITVDNFGEGANVAQEIAVSTKGKLSVRAVNLGDEADDREKFANKRAECYLRAREWLIRGGTVEDDALRDELSKIKYKRNLAGKIQIMDKKNLRKEMKKSPDRADAFALTFYRREDDYEEETDDEEEREMLYPNIGI
jgi:hypothetical protein